MDGEGPGIGSGRRLSRDGWREGSSHRKDREAWSVGGWVLHSKGGYKGREGNEALREWRGEGKVREGREADKGVFTKRERLTTMK